MGQQQKRQVYCGYPLPSAPYTQLTGYSCPLNPSSPAHILRMNTCIFCQAETMCVQGTLGWSSRSCTIGFPEADKAAAEKADRAAADKAAAEKADRAAADKADGKPYISG